MEIPIRMAAYLGATSRWFTPNPAQVRPPRPRASERKVMEVPRVMIRAVRVMNSAWQEIIVVRVSFVVKKLNTEKYRKHKQFINIFTLKSENRNGKVETFAEP